MSRAEFQRLTTDLRAGQKVFLISPRRYGKSSLIRRSLDALARERVLTVSVTVAGSSSYVGFLEAYAQIRRRERHHVHVRSKTIEIRSLTDRTWIASDPVIEKLDAIEVRSRETIRQARERAHDRESRSRA